MKIKEKIEMNLSMVNIISIIYILKQADRDSIAVVKFCVPECWGTSCSLNFCKRLFGIPSVLYVQKFK